MTKVDIISGFLGAGKTTFIKQMIDQVFQGQKLVLIENEFGEIGIDGGFLKDAGIEITEMNSGCICCTLVGDFSIALKKVLDEYAPDRVLIEPSGVGKLSDIVRAVEAVKKDAPIEIEGRIAVVDGKKAKMYLKNFGEFYKDQVASASTIVISRTQMMKPEAVEECVSLLRGENDQAAIITTPWEQLDADAIRRALEHKTGMEDLLEDVHDHTIMSTAIMTMNTTIMSTVITTMNTMIMNIAVMTIIITMRTRFLPAGAKKLPISTQKNTAVMTIIITMRTRFLPAGVEKLPISTQKKNWRRSCRHCPEKPAAARYSGPKEWKQFDLVPGEYEVREGRADYTGRLCVIGTDLAQDQLAELFHLV